MNIKGLEEYQQEARKSSKGTSALSKSASAKKCVGLEAYSINGMTEKLRKEMREAVYMMKGIAIRGQFTAIAAPLNGGKTLFTLKLLIDEVKAGKIPGQDIFYINVDDNMEGAIVYTEVFEEFGIRTLF